jgi:hypothetical protein
MAMRGNRLETILPAFPNTNLLLIIFGKHGEPVDFISEPILAWLITAQPFEGIDIICLAEPITFSGRLYERKQEEYAVEHPDGSCAQQLVTASNRAELLEYLVWEFRRYRRDKRRQPTTPDAP